jgi:hypothetical protein
LQGRTGLRRKNAIKVFRMKAIPKIVFFLITVVILNQCKKETGLGPIIITDDNFLNALIELGVDTNGDGIISPDEAEVITNLDVSHDSIAVITY